MWFSQLFGSSMFSFQTARAPISVWEWYDRETKTIREPPKSFTGSCSSLVLPIFLPMLSKYPMAFGIPLVVTAIHPKLSLLVGCLGFHSRPNIGTLLKKTLIHFFPLVSLKLSPLFSFILTVSSLSIIICYRLKL